jgi:hypothetical protein
MEVLDVAEALYEEQIIGMLRRAEVLAGLGKEMAEVLRENGVTAKHITAGARNMGNGHGSGPAPEGTGG